MSACQFRDLNLCCGLFLFWSSPQCSPLERSAPFFCAALRLSPDGDLASFQGPVGHFGRRTCYDCWRKAYHDMSRFGGKSIVKNVPALSKGRLPPLRSNRPNAQLGYRGRGEALAYKAIEDHEGWPVRTRFRPRKQLYAASARRKCSGPAIGWNMGGAPDRPRTSQPGAQFARPFRSIEVHGAHERNKR